MAWMYILEYCESSYYVGSTKNLNLRMSQHQEGIGANYTSKRLPVKLVYCEEYDRIDDAFYREKQVQGWTRRKREALINGTPELLPALAKKIFDKSKINKDNPVVSIRWRVNHRHLLNHQHTTRFSTGIILCSTIARSQEVIFI